MESVSVDRLAITIVDGSQARGLTEVLREEGFTITMINAVGGFLHDSLVTLLVGMPREQLSYFFAKLRQCCPRRTRYVPMGVEMAMGTGYPMMIEAHVGGASVFIVPVERFLQL